MGKTYWVGAALGAAATAGCLLRSVGWPPLDVDLVTLLIVAPWGAILGGGVVLAWHHVQRNPRILRPILATLIILSLFPIGCYQLDWQRVAALVAAGDSVRAKVTGRNRYGEL